MVKTLASRMRGRDIRFWLNGTEWTNDDPPKSLPIEINKGIRGVLSVFRSRSKLPTSLDVIHAHSPIAILHAMVIKLLTSSTAKIVYTYHYPANDSFPRRALKAWLFSKADLIHSLSYLSQKKLADDYGVNLRKCSLIYLGVDAGRFSDQSKTIVNQLGMKLGINGEDIVIGYIGRFDEEKNVSWLIRFLAENHQRFPLLKLLLFGGGPLEGDLKSQALRCGAPERIIFGGYTNQPEQAYSLMDLHVLPSNFEAFPLTVVEASLCGKPTLRTNVGGAIDQIENNVDGFVCELSEGYDGFSERLSNILEQEINNLDQIGSRSQLKMRRMCDVDLFGDKIMNLYRKLSN